MVQVIKKILAISIFFKFLTKYMSVVKKYLKNLIRDNKLPIFIKLILKVKNFQLVKTSFLFKILKNIYNLK